MERLINRTTVAGVGIKPEALIPTVSYNPDNLLLESGWHFLDAIVDGNTTSYYQTNRGLEKNEYIQVTLPKITPVKGINLLQANLENPTSFIYNGILEYSLDMNHWKPIQEAIYPEVLWHTEHPIKMKAVRVRILESQTIKPIIREFQIIP